MYFPQYVKPTAPHLCDIDANNQPGNCNAAHPVALSLQPPAHLSAPIPALPHPTPQLAPANVDIGVPLRILAEETTAGEPEGGEGEGEAIHEPGAPLPVPVHEPEAEQEREPAMAAAAAAAESETRIQLQIDASAPPAPEDEENECDAADQRRLLGKKRPRKWSLRTKAVLGSVVAAVLLGRHPSSAANGFLSLTADHPHIECTFVAPHCIWALHVAYRCFSSFSPFSLYTYPCLVHPCSCRPYCLLRHPTQHHERLRAWLQ